MEGVWSDKWRGQLLKKSDLTLKIAHDCCRTFEAAELQKYKLNTPTVVGTERSLHPLRNLKVQKKTPCYCKFCSYSEMPPPSDKKGVLRKLGTVHYLDKFIEQKANLKEPIS